MSNIPAANVAQVFRTIDGNLIHLCYKVKGSTGATGLVAAMKSIYAALIGNVDDTAGINYQVTFSGGQVTYGGAPTNNKYHYLHLWGI